MFNAFRRRQDRYGDSTPIETPYQRAAQAWDDRIGSARVQARNWRMIAFACAGLAAVAIGGLIYAQHNTKIATYIARRSLWPARADRGG